MKTARKARKRAKRKTVGARSAASGKFVDKEKLEAEPDTTVAVTREEAPPDTIKPDCATQL